jgi:hypothetical protein
VTVVIRPASSQVPDFQRIPSALRGQPRWVTARDKAPFMALLPDSHASVSDPDTWATFSEAQTAYEEGGWHGVGFVFNGDGIVGVDLDDCVTDGRPSDEAIQVLNEIGCDYVEYSQSGRGLHAYGFHYHQGPCPTGRRGLYRGIKVELYCSGRFFVVTGRVWRDGCLPVLSGFESFHSALTGNQCFTEAIASVPSVTSVSSVSSVRIPPECIPTRVGVRHDCIFELARYLKGVHPKATDEELAQVLQSWWVYAEPVVGTKDYSVSLEDFHIAWHGIKFPKGELLNRILEDFPDDPPSNAAEHLGMSCKRLYHLCRLLDAHQKIYFDSAPFFLGCRIAGEILGIEYQRANELLRMFAAKGFISVVKKGEGYKATRYRLNAAT